MVDLDINFPPQVRIFDKCKLGSGAKAFSVLGSTGKIVETYDDIEDVEEYNFNNRRPLSLDLTDAPWGNTYSLIDQKYWVIGIQHKIISLDRDTGFEQELDRYLDFFKSFNPNKPWWTTRDNNPVRVIGAKGNHYIQLSIGLGVEVKLKMICLLTVEFEAFGQGSHKNRNVYFQFTSRDGRHSFRVKGVTGEKKEVERPGETCIKF